VRAVLRRVEPSSTDEIATLGEIAVDRAARAVTVADDSVELTAKEFDLLAYFVDHAGIVLSRERLLDRVWGLTFPGGTRTVDVHVAQLRKKLGRPELIRTVRGAGYKAVAR
jgi:DNA-binding response OmpR family regulator